MSRSDCATAYHQLSLEDDHGCVANWVIPLPLKKLSKQSVLLWLLPTTSAPTSLACVESGPVRQVPTRNGKPADLRRKLTEGLLQLNFSGHWLSGYHRLRRLPDGSGQLWQLTPIS
ncbi:hypothetical protein [Hymenobacter arizonensis]|uniref:hypothetical protein n=1 Tax=Hymenobacter arizonensis TaxID=1227077 RepID=UPI000B829E44|nr:hypothetical protein [Hymenobacter arizonensis]